jgi:hypothetical protein
LTPFLSRCRDNTKSSGEGEGKDQVGILNIVVWDEIKERSVSAESLRRRFVQRLEKPSSIFEGPVLYLPNAWDVFASTEESHWLTDIKDSSLDGYRIVKMGEWGKLCEIEREGGKITLNRSLESVKQLPYSVIQTFLAYLATRFGKFTQYPLPDEIQNAEALLYSKALVCRLLDASLASPRKPRLVPNLILPAPQERFAAVSDFFEGKLPFRWEGYLTLTLSKVDDVYRVVDIGERGSNNREFESRHLPDAVNELLEYMFGFKRLSDNSAWMFNPYSISQETF